MTRWNLVSLGDIADSIDYGVTASAIQEPTGPKFLRITDIQAGVVNWNTVPWCECDERSLKTSLLKDGDIVFARTGATTGKSYLITDCPVNVVFASYLIRVRLCTQADPRYVSHFFQTPEYWSQVMQNARGAAQPGVNASSLKLLKVPLPPLPEQRRIADVLDRAEALRAKRRAALAELDGLAQSIFLEMFGDPEGNPKRWPYRAVSTYVAQFQGGKSIEADSGEAPTNHRILKVSAVSEMVYRPDESKPVPDAYDPPAEHFVKDGDLLISRANTSELVGAVAFVKSTPSNLLLPDKIWRFIWKDRATVEPLFVWLLFQSRAVRQEIAKRATGTSGSMKNISQEKLFAIETISPPLALQQEFASRVAAVERLKAVQRASLAELDALFASLQDRAFRGAL